MAKTNAMCPRCGCHLIVIDSLGDIKFVCSSNSCGARATIYKTVIHFGGKNVCGAGREAYSSNLDDVNCVACLIWAAMEGLAIPKTSIAKGSNQ